jgi:hypothetical protein
MNESFPDPFRLTSCSRYRRSAVSATPACPVQVPMTGGTTNSYEPEPREVRWLTRRGHCECQGRIIQRGTSWI